MQVKVLSAAGGDAGGSVELPDSCFGQEFNEPLVHQVVVAYQAGARRGTRAQKNRAAVSGGGDKPWRQKGTGRARAGSIRSPLWRGGGNVFPASTRDFSQKVNRKMYRGALRSILSELLRQERLVVVDAVDVPEPRTKLLVQQLARLDAPRAVIVTEEPSDNLLLAARNLPAVEVRDVEDIDPVALIGHEKVVATAEALKRISERLQ